MIKKIIKFILIIGLFSLVFYGIYKDIRNIKDNVYIDPNGVEYNGWLQVKGNKLLNEKGKEFKLKGVSTHGIQWFTTLYTQDNIAQLKYTWGVNVLRVAMYTDPDKNGYIKDQTLEYSVDRLVDYAIKQDMYVIIDWHILSDGDPNEYKEEAMEFFRKMAIKYGDTPNVIFEICNEPNGDVTWKEIKEYSNDVINEIRKEAPKSLIIVGTPDFSKEITDVIDDSIDDTNVIYAVHFYAGTDGDDLMEDIDKALENDIPIFVSECGITDVTGDGKIYEKKFKKWIKFLNKRNISWIVWSFSNKDESTALLKEKYNPKQSYIYQEQYGILKLQLPNDFNKYLTKTGKIVKKIFKEE